MRGGSFDVESKERELDELRQRAAAPDLWNDPEAATEVTRKLARFERLLGQFERLHSVIDDGELMLELAQDESDTDALAEVTSDLDAVDVELAELEVESLYFGEHDDSAAIVSVHAGAGGVDAQDWAEILLRMYLRFLENGGFDVEVDAAFALLLAVYAARTGMTGPYVVLLGLPHYLFRIAGSVLPWLNQPLPERFSRKAVCVLQIAALIAVLVPLFHGPALDGLIIVVVLALLWSFGRDIRWLYRTRT